MARKITDLTQDEIEFLTERHHGTLTTLRDDGSPHVVAIAFTVDSEQGIARVISSDGSQKVKNIERSGRAAICQVDGRRWLTLEGDARVKRDADHVRRAETAFEARYRPPRPNPSRVAIEVTVERILGKA